MPPLIFVIKVPSITATDQREHETTAVNLYLYNKKQYFVPINFFKVGPRYN
jgi:hypothetical protein